ncbi:MAG: signal peptidase II [Algiphilus sp.]
MRLSLAAAIMFSTFVIDLVSKWFVETHVTRLIPVMPSFNITLGYNRGVSFGLFDSESPHAPYVLAAFALVIVILLSVALWRSNSLVHTAGFAAIIGGALGNVVDRLGDGAVTDFLDLYAGRYHWPTFNLADTFIFCGVTLLLIPYGRAEAIAALESEQPSSREP